jgi:hypothetical protein
MGWDWQRFTNTLDFFGALPIVNWFRSAPQVSLTMDNQILFDFSTPHPEYIPIWGCLDDVVMGGVSNSNFILRDESAVFTGVVSTENRGGFVSVRTRNFQPPIDLSAYTGMTLTVRGDGNRYKFFLRDSSGWDSLAYSISFNTTPDQWQTVHLPFAEFIPVFRAQTVPSAPPLDRRSIRSLQLMLSKFEVDGKLNPHFTAGNFQLEVKQIGVF